MHTLAERHQDGRGGGGTVSPGPSDRPFDYHRFRERLENWVIVQQCGLNPVVAFQVWEKDTP